ncbi:MFS transporter [Streptomyces sp. NPDC001663]|uniref:MFS transporter n=1 Tax=Streptomyces sp. NPDC001663 TaxID=3364597 RepID=UPI0036BC1E0D
MSLPSNEPLAAHRDAHIVEAADAVTDSDGSLRRQRLWWPLIAFGLACTSTAVLWGAVQSVFLGLQVQRIDPNGAAGSLSLIVSVGAIAAMLSAPIAGALSDRTRSRIGPRGPWVLIGGGATLALGMIMAFATSIPELLAYWFLMQIATNIVYTPVTALIPDRVPPRLRGLFSSVMGTTQVVGLLFGQTLGAWFSDHIFIGYTLIGVLVLATTVTFAHAVRKSNKGEPKPPLDIRALLKTFWVNPVKYPNFAWAFAGRFLLAVGYFPLTTYTLYLLQSYVGLGKNATDAIPLFSLVGLVGTLVGTPFSGTVVDKMKRTKPMVAISSVILAASFVPPMIWPTENAMLVFSFLSGVGFGAYTAVDQVLVTQVLPSADDYAKDLGIVNITMTLPQTIGIGIGGAIVTVFGGYFALFPIAIVLVIAGAVSLLAIRGVR